MDKNKPKFNFSNLFSVFILILFLVIEISYLKIYQDNNIKSVIDSFPQNLIQLIFTHGNKLVKNEETDSDIIETSEQVEESDSKRFNFKAKHHIATVSEAYFENSLFVGDSRMYGFSVYRQLQGATYYCYQSAGAFSILEKEHKIEPYGVINLYNLLMMKSFDKIYISLGINNVGSGLENHKNHYRELLDTIKELQPNAIIYLIANLHVAGDIESDNKYLNNENINNINRFISEFEDKEQVYYFDPNVMYDDEYGNMNSELSYDKAHIYLRYYDRLLYFLLTHAVVYDE